MPITGGFSGGGENLGNAHGTITIDTSQAAQAAQSMRTIGRQMEQSMSGLRGAAAQAQSAFNTVAQGVQSLRAELTALSLATGAVTAFGLNAARDLRAYTVAFRTLLGSQKESERAMRTLTDTANEFGLELESTLQLGRALLPILQGNTAELENWVKRAALLRSIFPVAQRGAETRAIAEFLAGQTVSIQRLFNIPPELIQQAQASFQDYGAQLDFILQRMGATEQGAREMADQFVSLTNELKLTLAVGFTPLFREMQSGLRTFREWLEQLRETNPALLHAGAGFTAFVALATPALLIVSQLIVALQRLQAIGALNVLGRAGLVGAAVGGGFLGGVQATRFIGQATGNEMMAEATTESVWLAIRRQLISLETTLAGINVMINTGLLRAVQAVVSAFNAGANAIGRVIEYIGSILPGRAGERVTLEGQALQMAATTHQQSFDARIEELLANVRREEFSRITRMTGAMIPPSGVTDADRSGSATLIQAEQQLNADRLALIADWATAVKQIEESAAQSRLEATQQYERQRADVIASYELTIAREAEDFARQRARQMAQLERGIMDVLRNAAERRAEYEANLAETLADVRADTAKRLAELEEKYQRDRERAATTHRENLLNAAARLDATAIVAEQRRFANENRDREENYRERVEQERENLAERIAQEQEAHTQRLEDAQKADEQRIADLRRNLADQQRIEDEDRAIRLARQAEDHTRQLAQLDANHTERLAQIDRQAAQERSKLDSAFQAELAQLGEHHTAWLRAQEEHQKTALEMFEKWWEQLGRRFSGGGSGPAAGQPNINVPQQFASGGPVNRTGAAIVHAGEYVLNPTTTRMLSDALGGFSQNGLVNAVRGGRNITVAEGAIQIHATGNWTPEVIGRVVHAEFLAALQRVAA